ncbi:MAG: GNAT family N-acetyltransferase [Jejuia sp.]
MIRSLENSDIQELLDIYNYYVEHTVATFDIEKLTFEVFQQKLNRISKDYPFFIYEVHGEILGFAYASKFRPKPAYDYTVESTVYVKEGNHGKQIGSKLYEKLITQLKLTELHSVLGVLTLPNATSEKLHEKFGFEKVGHLKDAGLKFGKWHDVGIYQLKLN